MSLEDPNFAAAGVTLSPNGGLVQPARVCPHGFAPSDACQCFLNRRNAPTEIAGCKGREFHVHPVAEVIDGVVG